MRPLTAQQCYSCPTDVLPMGCCCSNNNKIHPDIEKRRAIDRKLKDSVFAPSALAVVNPSPLVAKNTKSYSFAGSLQELQVLSSSGETFEVADDVLKYNKTLLDKSRQGKPVLKPKVPKTKGFNFPIFPPIHGQGPNSTPVSRFRIKLRNEDPGDTEEAASVATEKDRPQSPPSPQSPPKRIVEKYRHHNPRPKPKQAADIPVQSGLIPPVLPLNRRPNDHLVYRKIEKEESDDDFIYTDESSEELEQRTIKILNRKGGGKIGEKTIVAVKRKNGSEEFYEQTYSKSNFSKWPKLMSPDRKGLNVEFAEDVVKLSAKSTQRKLHRKNLKAADQRLLDSYLAQPKALIVPIIKDQRKRGSTVDLEERTDSRSKTQLDNKKQYRRILKKPWLLNPSQKSIISMKSSTNFKELRFSSRMNVDSANVIAKTTKSRTKDYEDVIVPTHKGNLRPKTDYSPQPPPNLPTSRSGSPLPTPSSIYQMQRERSMPSTSARPKRNNAEKDRKSGDDWYTTDEDGDGKVAYEDTNEEIPEGKKPRKKKSGSKARRKKSFTRAYVKDVLNNQRGGYY